MGNTMLDGAVGGCRKIMEKNVLISVSLYASRYLRLNKFTLQVVGTARHIA